uniref:Calcium-independent phospholipase A2-gamma n=1 Tax=Talaromyces marneffei PM1 TaxID=1077442 RepID=A0A093XBG7_TALMA
MSDTIHHIAENVYSQLLGTFSDVAAGTANFYPSLLLVVEKERPETYIETDIKAELLGSLARKTALSLFDYFSDVDVCCQIETTQGPSSGRYETSNPQLCSKMPIPEICILIENQFVLRSQENTDTSTKTSAAAHRRVLKEFQPYLQDIHTLCSMICLQRPPEHKLPCGHAVCDTCIQIHHESSGHDPWSFELEECPLCKSTFTPRVTVKMHNPARGFRVLCLDGGGCRGIIPLKFLQALEDRIDLPLPVQQNFDIFVAPSSEIFGNLAKEAFEPRQLPLLSLPLLAVLTVLMQTVVSLLTGCKYPTKGIEIAVKKVFTEDLTMSDCSHATEIGAKIAVLVTEVVGCKPFLFTNYHGKQRRKSDCGYRVVEISGNESDPRVWEIARCTSAAPWYFKPQSIASLGAFQDGGLWMNDPTALVDSEIKVIASEEEEPLVVSLGTGSVNVDRPASPSVSRRAWKNGLIYRFFEALMSSIGSKRYWRSDNNYYRFNVKFDHEEPKLDDTQQIPAMASRADEQFRSSGQLDELAFRLIAAHFHFELEDLPRRVGDRFAGVGHILCDLKKGHPAYDALVNHLTRSGAKFYLNGSPIAGNMADRAFKDSTGNVRQRVEFMIAHETLSIQLKVRQSDPQQISGSPFCIAKRIRDQNLDSFFGQANHRKRKHSAQDGSGKSNKRQKIHQ